MTYLATFSKDHWTEPLSVHFVISQWEHRTHINVGQRCSHRWWIATICPSRIFSSLLQPPVSQETDQYGLHWRVWPIWSMPGGQREGRGDGWDIYFMHGPLSCLFLLICLRSQPWLEGLSPHNPFCPNLLINIFSPCTCMTRNHNVTYITCSPDYCLVPWDFPTSFCPPTLSLNMTVPSVTSWDPDC